MAPRVLVVGLVPRPDLVRFLEALRARYPEAELLAVVGTPELAVTPADGAAECLVWSALSARRLARELRRRRADLLVVTYNREYADTVTSWKVLALASLSQARGVLWCEQAQLPERDLPVGAFAGAGRRLAALGGWGARLLGHQARRVLIEVLIWGLSAVLFLAVLSGIILVDLLNTLPRAWRHVGRTGARTR